MAREKKKKAENQDEEEANPELEERKKLKKLAYSNNILSQTPAKVFTPLTPSKTVIKHHGTDILKKSQRKNRYLFSFSGLFAPISGGKIGELTHLGSKNPILYLDFPQGRMKLFGTIVYPKNRYLTLQFSRGGKNVMCEDCFDTMIVFSDACWVGKKEQNPDETRLDFPKELYERTHLESDFEGGAGATAMRSKNLKKVVSKSTEEESLPGSPVDEMEAELPERCQKPKDVEYSTPVRQSGRTTGKTFNFAEVSSGDDSADSVSDMSGEVNKEAAKSFKSRPVDIESPVEIHSSEDTAQKPLPSLSSSGTKGSSCTSLVQATISTLFKKAEEKNTSGKSTKATLHKVSSEKMQLSSSKLSNKKVKTTAQKKVENILQDKTPGVKSDRKKRKAELAEEIDGSDDDWQA
ncbi:DNA-binding protein RHL1 isoform X2 [Beta vulgaris subsp. vulgaris]|uniref:DNA-binding protein RHL1 isoform X2 n=1 Tax=Beta vulgaris subsp. vulgaris TaxID=3555 RepID=UPI0005401744|nr:DNA-binding protein RHL1 isoform X2 [Beta vulgaris subsp. vulgaris]